MCIRDRPRTAAEEPGEGRRPAHVTGPRGRLPFVTWTPRENRYDNTAYRRVGRSALRQGKALYAGISSYSPGRTREAAGLLRDLGTPLLISQPSYSMFNRWIENGLLDALADVGAGCIVFSALAQGLLTDRYLHGVPEGSRASRGVFMTTDMISEETLGKVRALTEIARRRGQTLAQMAVAWTLRDPRVTSALVGAGCRCRSGRASRRTAASADRPRWAQARRTNSTRTSSTPKCARAQWPFPTPSKRWRPTGTRPGSTTSGRRPPRRGHPLRPRRSLPHRHRHRPAAVLITRTARRLGRLAPPPCTVVIPAIGPGWTGTATASPASDGEPPSVQGCWSDRRLRQLSAQPARELAKLLNIAVPATPLGRSLSGVISTIETLTERRVLLRSLREGIDCSTLTGRMLAGIFAAPGGLREGAEPGC